MLLAQLVQAWVVLLQAQASQVLVVLAVPVRVGQVVMAGGSVKLKLKHGRVLATASAATVVASPPELEALLVQLLEEWVVQVAMAGESVKHGVPGETAMVVRQLATVKMVLLLETAMELPLVQPLAAWVVQVVTAVGATRLSQSCHTCPGARHRYHQNVRLLKSQIMRGIIAIS